MKVFVTGATGAIGAHLVKSLSDRGNTVHILVRSLAKAKELSFKGVVPFVGDITNKRSIDQAIEGCTQVYHLAACAKVWAKNTGHFYKVNVQGTENVLQSALEHKIDKVVVTSTAGVLGPSINSVITEKKIRDVDFLNEYEGSKSMAESKIKDFVNVHGLNVVIVSPSRVYGPLVFGSPSSTTLMIDKYVNGSWRIYPGKGIELGNYVYIEDVISGHLLAMDKGQKGQVYLLGGENYDYKTFYKVLSEVSGVKRKMVSIPYWFQMILARLLWLRAETFLINPLFTPKWVRKGFYDWELSSEKSVRELGVSITPLKDGLIKTANYLKKVQGDRS